MHACNTCTGPQVITDVDISSKTCTSAAIKFITSNSVCDGYTITAELRNGSSRLISRDMPLRRNDAFVEFDILDLQKATNYCVCAVIRDPVSNVITLCGIDLPGQDNYVYCSSNSIRASHVEMYLLLMFSVVFWIKFVLY